jgi:DNA-binding transcriptional regulator YiaG
MCGLSIKLGNYKPVLYALQYARLENLVNDYYTVQMIDLNELSGAIRQARKGHKISQHQLADRAGVSRALIATLESGRLPEVGFRKLLRILNAVGLDLRLSTFNQARPTFEDLLDEDGTRQ